MTRDAGFGLKLLGLFFLGLVLSVLLIAIAAHFEIVLPDAVTKTILLLPLGVTGLVLVVRWVMAQSAFRRGLGLYKAGHFGDSLNQLERAINLAQHERANVLAAQAEIMLMRFEEAIDRLDRILESEQLQEDRARAFAFRAFCYAVLNRMSDPLAGISIKVDTGFTLLIQAITAAHRSDWAAAEALLMRPEMRELGGFYRALSEALLAWTARSLHGESREVSKLRLLGESSGDRLRKHWPELMRFVDSASID